MYQSIYLPHSCLTFCMTLGKRKEDRSPLGTKGIIKSWSFRYKSGFEFNLPSTNPFSRTLCQFRRKIYEGVVTHEKR